VISIILFTLCFALQEIIIITLFKNNKINNDTLYFILANTIYYISIFLFYFYYQDYLISFIFSILFLINEICLNIEIAKIYKEYLIYTLPHILFNIYLSIILLI